MNPDTGEFVPVEMVGTTLVPIEEATAPSPIPKDWPIFTIGEMFELKDVPFELVRINDSTLVLRPKIEGTSARKALTMLTKEKA